MRGDGGPCVGVACEPGPARRRCWLRCLLQGAGEVDGTVLVVSHLRCRPATRRTSARRLALARQTRRDGRWLDVVDAGYARQPEGVSAIAVATAWRRLSHRALGGVVGPGHRRCARQRLRSVSRQANRRDRVVPLLAAVVAPRRCRARRSLLLLLLAGGALAGRGRRRR